MVVRIIRYIILKASIKNYLFHLPALIWLNIVCFFLIFDKEVSYNIKNSYRT